MVEEEGGIRLSKRYTDQGGEVDNKTKSGTAWSHNFLNQKPWHPLSYPNQRRKWIAEQTNAQHERRAEEVAREFAQEQEFFRQTALISKKEKEKVELMKAVSFMYVRPPGYNAESAKAAEIADEGKIQENNDPSQDHASEGPSNPVPTQSKDQAVVEKKKPRPKDVFGRALPTEEEFDVLKNAPKHETGIAGRAKPFGVEVRNVKCLRCGTFGHQSGDRECSLKDVITSNEESRLKRDDPLTAILAHTEGGEPLKWELKQKPGISPPRGGFKHDDPNQQIVAEDIFDEYGGFLSGGNIPELLTDFNPSLLMKKKSTSKNKHKRHSSLIHDVKANEEDRSYSDGNDDRERRSRRREKKHNKKRRNRSDEDSDSNSDDKREKWSTRKEEKYKKKKRNHSDNDDSESGSFSDGDGRERRSKRRVEKYKKKKRYYVNDDSESESDENRERRSKRKEKYKKKEQYYSDDDLKDEYDDDVRAGRPKEKENKHQTKKRNYSDEDSERESRPPIKRKQKQSHYYSSASKYTVDDDGRYRSKNHNRDHHPSRSHY